MHQQSCLELRLTRCLSAHDGVSVIPGSSGVRLSYLDIWCNYLNIHPRERARLRNICEYDLFAIDPALTIAA